MTSPESRKAVDRKSEVAGSVPARKVNIASVKAALNSVTAVRLINPDNGKNKLVYCQHDPVSQLTFVSSKLVSELKLKAFDNVSFDMNTMIGRKSNTANLIKFNIQSFYNDEMFFDITSVVNEPWCYDVSTLPHIQQLCQFKHFDDVEILGLDNCNAVDVLIGNDNVHLMYAKQERVGDSLTEPHAILTPLGWLAYGGRSGRSDRFAKIFRTNLKEDVNVTSRLKQTIVDKDKHIAELESVIKDLAMKNELRQPSRSDLAARKLVEPHVKLNCNRFEIPVPLKNDVNLPNNYVLARDRVSTLRKKALKQSDLGELLSKSMSELRKNGYIERASDEMECSKSV